MTRSAIGVVPLVRQNKRWHIVLVTSRGSGKWIFPKGRPEKGMNSREVAALEAFEEAGVLGQVKPLRLSTQCRPTGNECIDMTIHPMLVRDILKRWPEKNQRRRMCVPFERGVKLLASKRLQRTCRRLLKKVQ